MTDLFAAAKQVPVRPAVLLMCGACGNGNAVRSGFIRCRFTVWQMNHPSSECRFNPHRFVAHGVKA